jgi:20S proteasome alpha/beta subunit
MFLFEMFTDYLFQVRFLNWYSQLILKGFYRRSLATPDLFASIVHGTYIESDFFSVGG